MCSLTGGQASRSKFSIPKTFRQAITGDDAPHWKSAMSAEYQSLMKHNTWNLVPRPQSRNIVSCKWIYKTKEVETDSGEIDIKYKARLVAKGYSQVHGVDYEETFAPFVKFTSVRILLTAGFGIAADGCCDGVFEWRLE
jgi:Reverse transcriptase (RNA-dependent DNA polymerase)